MSKWARAPMLKLGQNLLGNGDSRLGHTFGQERISHFMRNQWGAGFSPYRLWAVLMLESWLRTHTVRLPNLQSGTGPRRVALPIGS